MDTFITIVLSVVLIIVVRSYLKKCYKLDNLVKKYNNLIDKFFYKEKKSLERRVNKITREKEIQIKKIV